MKCSVCGGVVRWRGPLSGVTHSECDSCGAINAHEWEVGEEEGDQCRRDGCMGILEFGPVENCSCHLHPPCNACVANPLVCPECGWSSDDE